MHFAAVIEQFLGECVVASRETACSGTCISSNSDPFTDNHNERTQHTTIDFLEIWRCFEWWKDHILDMVPRVSTAGIRLTGL